MRVVLIGAALTVGACETGRGHYQGPPREREAEARPVQPGRETELQIERAMDRYSSMLATMDADGIAAMYTPDGVMERQSGPPLRGREEIRSFLASPANANNVRVLSNRMTTNSLAYNGPEVLQRGEFEQSVRVNGKTVNAAGKFEATWVKGPRGAWYISRMATKANRN